MSHESIEYPLRKETLNKEAWTRRATSLLMLSFTIEEETIPTLVEVADLIVRLATQPLTDTLADEATQEFILTNVVPVACQKLINSKYFRNEQVLVYANTVLEQSMQLYRREPDLVCRYPKLAELIAIVFDAEASYFRTNNQLEIKTYPWQYFEVGEQPNEFVEKLVPGDLLDVLKFDLINRKATWSRGQLIHRNGDLLQIKMLMDIKDSIRNISARSIELAPLGTKSLDWQWRVNLKVGDTIDCCDNYGAWYVSTIIKLKQLNNNSKSATVGFREYLAGGERTDHRGRYNGLTESFDEDNLDISSPRIQRPGTLAKHGQYSLSRTSSDSFYDQNDNEIEYVNGERMSYIPRSKHMSSLLFKVCRKFINNDGYEQLFRRLEKQNNWDVLVPIVTSLGSIAVNLHRKYANDVADRLKPIIHHHLFDSDQLNIKKFSREKSDFVFNGMKNLMKRTKSQQDIKEYENGEKLGLTLLCLNSETLKRKIQGVGELKEVVRSYRIYLSNKIPEIVAWLRQHQIFQRIYTNNTHVEILKRSVEYFRFLVLQNALSTEELASMYRCAQKCDFETKMAYYKLFEEVSRHMKKQHINFVIDQLLEGDMNNITSEDVDLLFALSKQSNYFPVEKVMPFFEKILMKDNVAGQLLETCLKKFTEIAGKNNPKSVLERFIQRLKNEDGNPAVILKIMRNLLGDSAIDYNRYHLLEVLGHNNFDRVLAEVVLRLLKEAQPGYLSTVKIMMEFLAWAANVSTKRFKISLDSFVNLWSALVQCSQKQEEKELFYNWAVEVCRKDNIGESKQADDLHQILFRKLTNPQQSLTPQKIEILRWIFIHINKKLDKMHVVDAYRNNREHMIFRVKVALPMLTFYDELLKIYFQCQESVAQQLLELLTILYESQPLTIDERLAYFASITTLFEKYYNNKEFVKVARSLNLLEMIFDESEKHGSISLDSLSMMQKGEPIHLNFVNEISHYLDKKFQLRVSDNITVLELRKEVAKKVDIKWQDVKLIQKDEIPEIMNARMIKECQISERETITVNKKLWTSPVQQPFLINGRFNPKAAIAVTRIFPKYSTDGKMSREQCRLWISDCVNEKGREYQDKINHIYGTYDKENKGYLTVDSIISFFEKACLDGKIGTVSGNFLGLGIREDFRLKDDPDQDVKIQELPRYHFSKKANVYEILFEMVEDEKNEEVARAAWKMLERLPVDTDLHKKIINLDKQGDAKWDIFSIQKPYKTLYALSICEYLADTPKQKLKQQQKLWLQNFTQMKGYENLYHLFSSINDLKSPLKMIEKAIIEFLLRMLEPYLISCFATHNIGLPLAILRSELDLDSLFVFFTTNEVPQKAIDALKSQYNKLKIPPTIPKSKEWKGSDRPKEIISEMIIYLRRVLDNPNIAQETSSVRHCYNILVPLLTEESCQDLLGILAQLLSRNNLNKQLQFLTFKFILAISKASVTNNATTIIEWLFGIENSTNPYYFKTFTQLVEWFGIPQVIKSAPQKLYDSILNSENQFVVGGCAQFLCQMNTSLNEEQEIEIVKKIWERCLFGRVVSCHSSNTRELLFDLLLKMVERNGSLMDIVCQLVVQLLEPTLSKTKIVNTNDLQSRSPFGYLGMKNLGNICYMLAMLQQMFHYGTFRKLVMRADDNKPVNPVQNTTGKMVDDNVLHQLRKMFAYLEKSKRMDFAPHDFCFSFKGITGERVNIGTQQDAQQFVSVIFDRLEEAMKKTPYRRIVNDIYRGKMCNMLTCSKCNAVKETEEFFYSLSVEVKNSKNLMESLGRLIQGETINDYKCDFCQERADVSRKSLISHSPNILIVHLKRIVFNLDILINEKINSKLQFPMKLDLKGYVKEQPKDKDKEQPEPEYTYDLVGVIAHYGTAEFGHYYSYIKTQNGQWLEFNDSKVLNFDLKNLESECFGQQFPTTMQSDFIEDQYDLGKKENSKNAYMLVYEKSIKKPVTLSFPTEEQAQKMLVECDLKTDWQPEPKKQEIFDEIEQDVPVTFRKLSKQCKEVELEKPELEFEGQKVSEKKEEKQEPETQQEILVNLKEPVSDYFPNEFFFEIDQDNELHQKEVGICAQSFVKFFVGLIKLRLPENSREKLIQLTQKLIFGMWLKNPMSKFVIKGLTTTIRDSQSSARTILQSENLATMMIENSDADMRSWLAQLLAASVLALVNNHNLTLTSEPGNQLDQFVTLWLDNLLNQLHENVAKNWQRFGQFFEFWRLLAEGSQTTCNYMLTKDLISIFVDFQMQKKSPLKLCSNRKHTFGNRYTQPNFYPLFQVVGILLQKLTTNGNELSSQARFILCDFNLIDKLFLDSMEKILKRIVSAMCPNNIRATQKITVVLLKGMNRATFETLQPYLEIVQILLSIKDQYRMYRIKWLLGNPTPNISADSKLLTAGIGSYVKQRLYYYHSSLHVESGTPILQPLYKFYTYQLNASALNLKCLLTLCLQDKEILNYIINLPPPSFNHCNYYSFFKEFLKLYEDSCRTTSHLSFPKQEMMQSLTKLYSQFEVVLREVTGEVEHVKVENMKVEKTEPEIEETKLTPIKFDIPDEVPMLIGQTSSQQFPSTQEVYGGWQSDTVNQSGKKEQPLNFEESITDDTAKGDAPPQYDRIIDDENLSIENNANANPDNQWEEDDPAIDLSSFDATNPGKQTEKVTKQRGQAHDNYYFNNYVEGNYNPDNGGYNEDLEVVGTKMQIYDLNQESKESDFDSKRRRRYDEEKEQEKQFKMKSEEEKKPERKFSESTIFKQFPIDFRFREISERREQGLILKLHSSYLTVAKLPTDGIKVELYGASSLQKFLDKLPEGYLEKNKVIRFVDGIHVSNPTREYMRIKWREGCILVRPGDNAWLWNTQEYDRIFTTDREYDWPKWALFE